MKRAFFGGLAGFVLASSLYLPVEAAGYKEIGQYGRPGCLVTVDSEEQIEEEIYLGELEILAQLVEAEAGNQPFEGKCLVVDTILNRVESPDFPNTISEVIFQDGQFSVVKNGAFDKAAWNMKDSDYAAVMCEVELHTNKDVLYFNNTSHVSGDGELYKIGGHWFRNG
jgi:hypothetical protein